MDWSDGDDKISNPVSNDEDHDEGVKQLSDELNSAHQNDTVSLPHKNDTRRTTSTEPESHAGDHLFQLSPEFLQRSPSAQTVTDMTIAKFNTIPRTKKEAGKRNPIQSQHVTTAPVTVGNISPNWDEKNTLDELNTHFKESNAFKDTHFTKCQIAPRSEVSQARDGEKTTEIIDNNDLEITPINLKDESLANDVCIECVTAIQVFSKDHIHPGDHISFPGKIYDHHAIVVGVCDYESQTLKNSEAHIEIVHATNTATKAVLAFLHPFGNKAALRHVNAIVSFKESKVMVYKYNYTINQFSPQEIVRRATEEAASYRDGKDSRYIYNLFENNCEHFATWCVTGRKLSIQVRKFTMVFRMFLRSGFYDISDEQIRNEKEYENGMLCKTCYDRNNTLLDIPRKLIDSSNDVNAGDIIVYSYFLLWHNAVVLRKIKSRKNYIKCEIAHYAYLGPFKHRTIIKEDMLIPLDSTVMVLSYPDDKFNTYDPLEVVRRAESRIGEQMFSFFRNDSSQFSRWCKLKLEKSK